MIEYIKGELVEETPAQAVVECNGMGYGINISLNTYSAIQGKNNVKLYIYEAIREDAHVLYGFATKEERELFLMLISVSGIGGNTARMILSALSPTELCNVISNGNDKLLKTVKGIGLKTAQRIIVELKDKIASTGIGSSAPVSTLSTTVHSEIYEEAVAALTMLGYTLGSTLLAFLFAEFVIPFDIVWVQLAACAFLVGHLLYNGFNKRIRHYFFISLFTIGSIAFFYSADYVLNNILEDHQRVRINVLLGLDDDLSGAGYNVHQSEIAIGSGGLKGKGFLNGTQTKLKFVPEQDTDFIFCTVGEEEGFLGSAGVLLLFLALILRLIKMAERQPFKFGRVYGYCVLSIFLFHVFINVGMVLGLTPVIGIPLPFFSYGGSSLWGFTILLFIFLRIDAGRNLVRT